MIWTPVFPRWVVVLLDVVGDVADGCRWIVGKVSDALRFLWSLAVSVWWRRGQNRTENGEAPTAIWLFRGD
jgi:hypothetical protein